MLIGLDASRLAPASAALPGRTGTETYSLHLIRNLLALDDGHRFRLYLREPPAPGLLVTREDVEQRVIRAPRLWTHLGLSWEMARRPPDVLFVPAHVIPLWHPRRNIVTVHDLGYRLYPMAHRQLDRFYLDVSTRWSARAASIIIADSRATANDLHRFYSVPDEKVRVVYPGRDESLSPVHDAATLAALRAQYGLSERYILHVGTLQPRKNLVRLVEAFAEVANRLPETGRVQLVLAGQKGWLYNELFRRVEELGLQGRVIFPGYVPDADLPALLSGAACFAFPSLYEGFGFPVLEAQSCGVPVICSDVSSLPEVAGDGALLVSPHDTAAWVEALMRVLTDERLRAQLRARGFVNVVRFSWRTCAAEVMRVLEEAGRRV
ncbi:MAG: glycosyltransferase family 4 protein [Anaerolineae bacterium]|nr:glycosyltransferase family 4 protein [Anaerolineae bacterium]